ncbi:ATP-dependent DNA helicase RecG [Gracilinema caldarium]|uniref:ATP-dependent DNA helicase RecG n=1 Tax=Gracilinema caldarium (strain ATCC 51460 / DSM 7334 / H1) TaxID=744872 RepID=F8EXS6_GRAC1|nr:ATP-dependent DNA helicase RecG [Gracilinema caldarium]AEJ20090.1 ATP-dependent DNA helicase RecG [Gracilinema caldarium DSM 7334]
MFLKEIHTPIHHLKGAGSQTCQALARLGIRDIASLLSYYPRDWEDRSRIIPLSQWNKAKQVYTVVTVLAHEWFGYPKKTLKVHIEDDTARAELICFNRPFLEKQLEVGKSYLVWGQFSYRFGSLQSSSFEFEHADRVQKTAEFLFLPIYPLTAGLSQKILRRLVYQALQLYGKSLEDELPGSVLQQQALLDKTKALGAIHFPKNKDELEAAQRRIKYEELFYLEVLIGRRALERQNTLRRTPAPAQGQTQAQSQELEDKLSPLQKRLAERLPFELTKGQINAITEINRDMSGPHSMARLLQGDVGSGKTLVSFMAALRALEEGGQTALLAPTELLARQHAENAAKILEPLGVSVAFLTGNVKAAGRSALLKALAAGNIHLVIGTHALFSAGLQYHKLRLVIIDEQHRFGVLQRSAILAKGDNPDLLMMSATPIPRTLALTVFGDLDVSVISDLPPGRKPVKTHLARQSNEQKVYDFVRKELQAGHQAYFVYPLIEGDSDRSDQNNLKNAEAMAKRLSQEVFPEYNVALVHSRLDEEQKRLTMNAFRTGQIQILVATSVVEVGVDVPNATCMVVEHAERFGLSALHQLRGRVGRGPAQAYCFLVYSDRLTEDGKQRLKVMLEHNDGFRIAEEDLKLRGPGQIAGIEQSGYLSLGLADPILDASLLETARGDAFTILKQDPGLLEPGHIVIRQVLERASPFTQVAL